MEKTRVCVIGAAGRMGRRLVALIMESEDLVLSGAIEVAGNPVIGTDAGILAGAGCANVAISDNLDAALLNSDAVINFSTAGVVDATAKAAAAGCSAIIGTTALPEADRQAIAEFAQQIPIVFAPNMSVGVNLLFHELPAV